MKYLEVTFTTHPCNETVNDVVSALAGEIGFESFVECEAGVQAYIQQTLFDEEALKEMIASFPLPDTTVTYTIKEAEDKNWNEEWEKNFFQPIVIGDRCCIHSTFHKDTPKTEYEILINPQMNHIHNITVELGDANLLKGRKPFDVIIANINRNILLADLPHYATCMHPGSEIFMSGFYMQDIPFIREKAESLGMEFVHHREKNNWAAVKFIMK